MTFAVAYWTNAFGDPFLEQARPGRRWLSTAFATTRAGCAQWQGARLSAASTSWAPDDQ